MRMSWKRPVFLHKVQLERIVTGTRFSTCRTVDGRRCSGRIRSSVMKRRRHLGWLTSRQMVVMRFRAASRLFADRIRRFSRLRKIRFALPRRMVIRLVRRLRWMVRCLVRNRFHHRIRKAVAVFTVLIHIVHVSRIRKFLRRSADGPLSHIRFRRPLRLLQILKIF